MNKQLRHRVAMGFTALVMAATMAVGAVSVAADGSDLDGSNGVAQETTYHVTSAVAAPTQPLAIVGNVEREDGQ